jgi:hypothetical protein
MKGKFVVLLVLLSALGGAIVAAQASLRFVTSYTDYELAAPPCLSTLPVATTSHDGALWFTWTCVDGRAIVRGPRQVIHAQSPARPHPPTATCDATKLIGTTGINECQWLARYPRSQ